MRINEKLLLELSKEFVSFQQELLHAWRGASPSSSDTEMLLDFPKRCVVRVRSSDWTLKLRTALSFAFKEPMV